MIDDNVKQIKMANGDEVLCEIIEELEDDLVVRYCLTIEKVSSADSEQIETFYVMRPWMTYIEKSDEVITLSKYHIMGAAEPATALLNQYAKALKTIIELSEEESAMDELKDILKMDPSDDSNPSNVVKITNLFDSKKNKLH